LARTAHRSGSGRLARAAIGLLAVLVLAALVAGLPALLIQVAGNPLTALPDGDRWTVLTSRDNGQLFLTALAIIGWLAWATFTLAVLVEIPAQIRGRRTLRIPGLSLQQRLAAALVAAIAAAVATPSLSAAALPATSYATPPAAVSTHQPTTFAPTAPAAEYLQHEVQRGESLPGLAERYGVSRTALAQANHGQPQPDGRSLQPGQTRIYTGWTLRIPLPTPRAIAAPTMAARAPTAGRIAASTPAPAPPVYQVHRGDWLGAIAERFLGSFDRYPEIAALNPQMEARDHRFPDHIEATWRIVLPADVHDYGPRRHATGQVIPASPATAGDRQPQPPGPPAADPTTPAPSAEPTLAPSTTPSPTPSPPAASAPAAPPATTAVAPTGQPTSTTAAPAAPEASDDGDTERAIIVGTLAGAGLLAALMLRAVARRRRRQRQYRRPGRRAPNPRGGTTERDLRVVEQPADIDRLDTALRHLAAGLTDRDQAQLPDIIGAWIIGADIHVLLAERCPNPPPPWLDDGPQWSLPGQVALPDSSGQAPPLPTLTAVGSQAGRHLLLDLERLGTLSVGGDPDQAMDLLRYMASELACNSWSEEVDVLLAGFSVAEAELLVTVNPNRVKAVSSVPEAAARLRQRVATSTATLGHVGAADALAGRITDVAADTWMPQVLLVAHLDDAGRTALTDLAADLVAAGRCAVAVVAATSRPIAAATVDVTADGILHVDLPTLHTSTAAAGLPTHELAPLADLMRQARATADVPTPPAAEPEPWAADTDAAGALLSLYDPEPAEQTRPANATPPTTASAEETPHEPAAAVAATAVPTRRQVTAAVRQRRRQVDPHLDDDVRAWTQPDPTRPRIAILGPVAIDAPGTTPDERQRFHAEIIVLLAARGARGADRAFLEDALWPDRKVQEVSLRVAMTRARAWLGQQPQGQPWLPPVGSDRIYRLADGVLLDWHLFRRLRARGQAHGPAGIKDLRTALELVRGVPLDGADRAYATGTRNPYTWLPESDIYPPHITAAIVDTAHELAQTYLDAGDTAGARWAVHRGWLADPDRGDDTLWHDLMRAEHADGHSAELHHLMGELIRTRDAEVAEDLQPATYELLRTLLPDLFRASTM